MPDYTQIGDSVVLESSVPIVDPQQGLFWRQVFVGLQDNLYTYKQLLNIQADQRVNIAQRNGPIYQLEVITPDYTNGQSSSLNKFELVHNKVEKEIYEHPKATALGITNVRNIKKYVQEKTALDPTAVYFASSDEAILYSLAMKGSRKTLTHEWVFRYTIVASNRYGTLVSLANTEKLWTTAQLLTPAISGLIIPANTLFALTAIESKPDVVETVWLYDGDPLDTTTHTYKWSWLKTPPEFNQLPSGKMEIRQEWWLDLWSTWEYQTV